MKKSILCIALCIVLLFSITSCGNEKAYEDGNYDDYTIPETLSPPDWNDVQDALDALDELESGSKDAFEQIESKHTYVITYSTDLKYNNSVGNEWRCGVRYNDEYISSSSKIVIADSPTEIELVAFATELDDWNDYGTTYVTFDALKVGQHQTKWVTVIVRENEGRYTGNTAKWCFEITIERI